MNTNEFKHWLEGFIEGRDTLSEIELKIVQEKLSQLVSVSSITAFPIDTSNSYDITCNTAGIGSFTQTTTNDKIENNGN